VKRTLLWGHDQVVIDFVSNLAPIERPLWRDLYAGVGVLRADGALIGGVVFSEYKPQFGTLEVSAAALSYLVFSPQMLVELGAHVFGQLEVFRISARTSDTNIRAKRLLKGLGFTNEAVKGHFYGKGKHASEWRVIRPEWEKKWGTSDVLQKAA